MKPDICPNQRGGVLNRRTLLKTTAGAAGLAAVGLSAVPVARPAIVEARQDDSTLVFLATDSAYSLDPAQNWDYGGGATILAQVYEGLLKFTGADKATLEPNVAADIPSLENGGISADGLTYTFTLNPDAKFHDGSPIDAAAVKASYDRVKTLKQGVDFLFDKVASIDAVDAATVRFNLSAPFSPFLYSIGSLWGNGLVNPAIVSANSTGPDDLGLAFLQTADAGSGPYKLKSYDQDQKTASLERDPAWWQGWEDGAHIDTVIIQWITEPATVRSMLEQGDAQIAIGLTAEDWEAVSGTPGIVTSEHPASLQSLIMVNNKLAPFDNPKVRQALGYAINYDEVIGGIFGGHGTRLDGVVGPGYIGYAPAATQYTYDLEKAKALFAEAGYPDGLTMELYAIHIFPNDQLILELLQADLASIGVTLDVKSMDANAFLSKQSAGDPAEAYQGYMSNIGGDYPDAYEMLALVYGKNNQPPALCCNTEFYENAKMDEILARIENTLDPAERQAALQEGINLAVEEAGVLWIHTFSQLVAMRDNVQGWDYNFMYGANYAPMAKMSLA